MIRIKDFEGMQYSRQAVGREQKDYKFFNKQYASSSHQEDHDMNPDLIVQPKNDKDIQAAIKWAKENKVSIAVKSGGHQYSGASSTGGKNIQLDLSQTYKDLMVLPTPKPPNENKVWVYAGVSNKLRDFNAYLRAQGLFVPHGQCAYVCVGGHGQTGGYGQLGRSFGMFGDHIRSIRIITHDSTIKEITKKSDPEMFHAILGGSPGNFGIITHYTLEVYQDEDYMGTEGLSKTDKWGGPRGVKALWLYNPKTLAFMLSKVAEIADKPDFARNFDICISVLSTDFPMAQLFTNLKVPKEWEETWNGIKAKLPEDLLEILGGKFPPSVILYAQWCPTSNEDKYTDEADAWFQQFRAMNDMMKFGCLSFNEFAGKDYPMSVMTGQWIFPNEREYPLPYVKRTYGTSSTTLTNDKWVDTVVERIDLICNPKHGRGDTPEAIKDRWENCKLAVQIQPFGGNTSRFHTNAGNGTAYSWRDTTVCQVLDCFHTDTPEGKALAEKWQKKNDDLMSGPNSTFSKRDMRYLWGSYGDWDLSKSWQYYYEDEAKYRRLGAARAKADPNGTFTANPFAVEALHEKTTVANGSSTHGANGTNH